MYYRIFITVFTLFLLGCGSDSVDSDAQTLTDPTNQLPAHVNWDSYNLYRFESGSPGRWVPVISLGQFQESLPLLGSFPVIVSHGYGGDIRTGDLIPLAQNLIDNALATSVLGFEYDSQDGILRNGQFLRQAIQALNPIANDGRNWSFICHSAGGLVVRSAALGGPLPIATTGTRLITLGTPHLGSPVANAVQDNQDLFVRSTVVGVLGRGGFNSADGTSCEADLGAAGFLDLGLNSPFLTSLNENIGFHPQLDIFTIAGNRKDEYQQMNDLLGVSTDDGLVTVSSANASSLNALGSGTVSVNHTDIAMDSVTTFPLIRNFLVR